MHLTRDPVTGHSVQCGVGWASDVRVPPVRLEKIMKWAVLCLGEHVYFLSEMMDCAFAYDNQVFGSDYFRSKIS